MLFKYLKLASIHVKWVLDFLLYHPFFNLHVHRPQEFPIVTEEEEEVKIWHPHGEEEEEVDCAVCLCKISEGEEVRVLRCEHIFHRECLNKWVGFNNFTCPLCRVHVRSGARSYNGEVGGAQVLFFQFYSFSSNSDREPENWWLR